MEEPSKGFCLSLAELLREYTGKKNLGKVEHTKDRLMKREYRGFGKQLAKEDNGVA